MTTLDEILRTRFGLEDPITVSRTPLPVQNPGTRGVAVYQASDAAGRSASVFEKVCANRPFWAKTPPETIFYEEVLPRWPFMQGHVCEFFGSDRGFGTTTIFIAALARDAPAMKSFRTIAAFLDEMHADGAALLASGALDLRTTQALDYFRPAPRRRVHGDYARHLKLAAANPAVADLLAGREAQLVANLDALVEASREAPRAICHLDLLGQNIFVGADGPMFIDWGEARIAPAGFDHGSLLGGALRRGTSVVFRKRFAWGWARLRDTPPASGDHEAHLIAAYCFFVIGLVRHLRAIEEPRLNSWKRALIRDLLEGVSTEPYSRERTLTRIAAF